MRFHQKQTARPLRLLALEAGAVLAAQGVSLKPGPAGTAWARLGPLLPTFPCTLPTTPRARIGGPGAGGGCSSGCSRKCWGQRREEKPGPSLCG